MRTSERLRDACQGWISPAFAVVYGFACLAVLGPCPSAQAEVQAKALASPLPGLDLSAVRPAQMTHVLDMATMSHAQYAGAVSMAMEGMRLVYGDMTDEQEARFEARWQPLFNHPSQEVVAYLNKLNPLLLEFVAVRTALNDAAEAYDAAQLEVTAAASVGDPNAVQEAVASATVYVVQMRSLSARMGELTQAILELGEPPNAEDLRRRARQHHEDAFKAFQTPASLLAIVPPQLVAAPARPYAFKAVVGTPGDRAKLQLNWQFSDGKSHRTAIAEEVRHTFYLDPKRPKQSLDVQLIDTKSNKVLATVSVPIEVQLPQGQWVLVDRQVQTDPSTKGARFRGGRLNPDTGKFEPTPNPQDSIFDGFAEVQDLGAQMGNRNLPRTFGGTFKSTWSNPPLRLKPTEKFTFEVETVGEECNLGYGSPEAGTTASLDFFPWGPKQRTQEQYLGAVRADAKLPTPDQTVDPSQRSQRKAQELEAPRPYVKGPKGEPIEPTGQALTLTVSGSARFTQCTPTFRVTYRYTWDATGKLAALGEPGQAASAPGEGTGAGVEETEEARAERVKREQIEFHRQNIEYFRQNISSLEARISQTTDPTSRNDMVRDLLYQRDAMQREMDQIRTIETGQFVRTRTDLDALNLKIMAEESRQMAEDWGDIRRAIDRVQRLIDQAGPEDRDRLRKFFFQQVDSDVISRGDADHVRRVTQAIGNQVMGRLEQEAASTEEAAVAAAARLQAVQNVKDGADTAMMALSFVGGSSVYMTYQGATGYVEGGLAEAFQRTAGGYNTITTIAQAGIDGYQQAVLEHLEAYAQNPQQIQLDEQQAGFDGAMWSAGKAAAMAAAMKLGGYVLSSGECPPTTRPSIDTLRQQARVRAFRTRQTEGRIKVQLFQDRARALATAGKTGAPKNTIGKLRMEMEGAYRDVKTDYFAKLHLNAVGRSGDTKTLHYYNSCDRASMRKVASTLKTRMANEGYSEQQYKLFSNSASKGKAGMDVDLGAVEPPRTVILNGQKIQNPAHVEWRKGLTQRQPDGTLVRRSPQEFQEAGQKNLEGAFKEVFGRPPGEAMVAFTTTYHPEAYRDIKWLGKKGMKTALVHETDPRWVQQAADVTGFKINHLPKEHPQLGYYGVLQEQCRGMVKDFDTKLKPMFPKAKNPEAVKHMTELRDLMNQFALNQIGPVETDQRLRVLTGGEGMKAVQDRFTIMLKGLQSAVLTSQ